MKIYKYTFDVLMLGWDDEEETISYTIYDTVDPAARKQLKYYITNDKLEHRAQKIISRDLVNKELLTS